MIKFYNEYNIKIDLYVIRLASDQLLFLLNKIFNDSKDGFEYGYSLDLYEKHEIIRNTIVNAHNKLYENRTLLSDDDLKAMEYVATNIRKIDKIMQDPNNKPASTDTTEEYTSIIEEFLKNNKLYNNN